MSKETLDIVRENDHFRLKKTNCNIDTLETALFHNQSHLDCVVWFDDPATFGTQAILVGAAKHCELKFNRPVVKTRYALVEWLRTSPETIPGVAGRFTGPEPIPGEGGIIP